MASEVGVKHKGQYKFTKKKIALVDLSKQQLKKPSWIKVKMPSVATSKEFGKIKQTLRKHKLHTVCEEASCPNIGECFASGTATFMIMGDICTRRCPFCDVGHGRPLPLEEQEPVQLAQAIHAMHLKHVVITSVNRDDLKDGGAQHFANCITAIRELNSNIMIEVLVPDFRKHSDLALAILTANQPNIVNHNLETVPRLYKEVRPGADYKQSLELLANFKKNFASNNLTKSGLMLGIGETIAEVVEVLQDLRKSNVDMLTLGQYLQPSPYHLPLKRFVHPDEFKDLYNIACDLGFKHVASAPMVRSSYHADQQLTTG